MSEQVSQESDLHVEYDASYGDSDPTQDHPSYWYWLEEKVRALEERVNELERRLRAVDRATYGAFPEQQEVADKRRK